MINWNLAMVVGVPGVGKTSLCRIASESLGYNYVNYGRLMLQVAGERNLAYNLSELFQLDIAIQEEIWRSAAYIVKDQYNVLLDLHGIDRFKWGYFFSLPIEILEPDIIIIVESSYDDVLIRRQNDNERKKRLLEDYNVFTDHKNILRVSMAVCSVIFGSYLVILENDSFDDTLNQLKNILIRQ